MTFRTPHALGWLALVATTLAGCASTPPALSADSDGPICTKVYPVGSNIPTTRCMTAKQAEDEKRQFDQNPLRVPGVLPKGQAGG